MPLAGIQKTGEEVQISSFDAILRFDYNTDELPFENKELLRQMIDKLPNGTVITIYGSADALGTQQRNIQLKKTAPLLPNSLSVRLRKQIRCPHGTAN